MNEETKAKKSFFTARNIIGLVVLVLLSSVLVTEYTHSDGFTIRKVQDSYLPGHETTTVKNALDTFFADTTWKAGSTANGKEIVEFNGKFKHSYNLGNSSDMYYIPEGSNFKLQFQLTQNGYVIGYSELDIAETDVLKQFSSDIKSAYVANGVLLKDLKKVSFYELGRRGLLSMEILLNLVYQG